MIMSMRQQLVGFILVGLLTIYVFQYLYKVFSMVLHVIYYMRMNYMCNTPNNIHTLNVWDKSNTHAALYVLY